MRNKSVRDKGRQQTGGGIEYRIDVSQTELVADGIFVESYGVAVYRKGHKLCCVKNITVDRERMEKLVAVCNRCHLSLCHLEDVVEDFLAQL